ncbi:hypothetical protein MD484_g3750, partial [Candolleomyces efflorescens]
MSNLSEIHAFNLSHAPTYTNPVAVFVGGTSGIGQGMAEAFAKLTNGKATIIIVGRNKTSAESIISKLHKSSENPEDSVYEFVSCDVTLMRNVVAASKEILSKHHKVNFLVLTTGFFSAAGYEATEEGLERKLAVSYYSRWKFIHELLPALNNSKTAGEDAKVLAVLGAGRGREIDMDDLGLKKNYTLKNAAFAAPRYNDLMIEGYGKRYPNLTFIHAYPGTVRTNFAASAENTAMRIAAPLINILLWPFSISPAECAEYMWHGIFSYTDGPFLRGPKSESLADKLNSGPANQADQLWEHTVASTTISDATAA